MATWEVQVGEETTEVDLDFSKFTLQESIRLEDALGPAQYEAIQNTGDVPRSPRTIQAILWAKLVTQFPGLKLDGFDLDLSQIEDIAAQEQEVTIPMETPDGEVDVATVEDDEGKG